MREDRDELIDSIVEQLKVLPAVPADATARVLARVDAARRAQGPATESSDDDDIIFFPTATDEMQTAAAAVGRPVRATPIDAGARGRRRFSVSLPAAIGYALAATLAGFMIRGALPRSGGETAVVARPVTESASTAGLAVTPVSNLTTRADQDAPIAVQFVLDARTAKSVALVGDFNAWDESTMPLVRDSVTGVWSTVVKVTPGRHVYAFVVDGEKWTLDPRAQKATDADYGTEQSVIIVGLQ